MSRHLCCLVVVWVLLQLIYFSATLMGHVKSLERNECYKKFQPGIRMYFTQNVKCELSQSSKANEWTICNFARQRMNTIESLLTGDESRNVVSTMEFGVEKKRFILTLSNERIRNVRGGEKGINKFDIAFSPGRIKQYTVDLYNKIAISSIKLIDMSNCSNSFSKLNVKKDLKIPSIQHNSHSRLLERMQLSCLIDDRCCSWIFELEYKLISHTQEIVTFFLWISSYNFTMEYFDGFVYNFIFKDLREINVHIINYNGVSANLARMSTSSKSHINNFVYSRNSFKETTRESNDDFFMKKLNSRKNRFLLSVNSHSNLEGEKESIDTSQKVRYAKNEKVQSMSNQIGSPNENLYGTKIERRWKRKSRGLAKDLTSAAEAKRTIAPSSQQADATKHAARISFSPDNEVDYRRDIDRQIEAYFAKIKDSLRLEKGDAISSETFRWSLGDAKNNRQSVSQHAAIDTREPEIITAKEVCTAPRCQQVIRHGLQAKSRDPDELPTNSRDESGNVASSEQNGIAAVAPQQKDVDEKMQLGNNDKRKLVGEALIILNKNASPFSIIRRSDDAGVNLKYSVESISLGLDELLKMGKEVMKKELDNGAQNETKRAGLSCRNCLKYAKGNNETHHGLEDDEGTKLEEELKELRSMHIQRKQGFANSGKNEMRFAAGDEYILKKDENARLNNAYFTGHVQRARRRCHKKRKSPLGSNTSNKISRAIQNGNSYQREMTNNLQTLNNDITSNNAKTSFRIKKNNPYEEYEESSEGEKLFSDIKIVEHSRSQMKTSQETLLPSIPKQVIERKIPTPRHSHVKVRKNSKHSIKSDIPHKSVNTRSHKVTAKSIPNRKYSSMNTLVHSPQSQIKKKNKLLQSLSNRKVKITEDSETLRQPLLVSKSDTLSGDINNIYYYDYDDLEPPTVSLDQTVENSGLRRKLLSSNSTEYDERSPVSADEESNCDYGKKFDGDQLYEKEPTQLHYFQINLKNVMLPANTKVKEEGLGIEAQYYSNKSIKSISAKHKTTSKNGFSRRTLKSVVEEENSDYAVKKDSVEQLYLSGDLIGYNYDPEENENREKFKRGIDKNEDPDLARLFSDGKEYEINIRGKLHLRLKDPESNVASEKSSKKKRCSESKIAKPHNKLARTQRKFAIADKRTKRDPGQESAEVHKEGGNPKSKTSNKTKNPLKKISDFLKRKFGGDTNKKEYRKKIHANAKVVRIRPGHAEDGSQSTFPPSDQPSTTPESRRDDCKCAHETTTTKLAPEFTSVTVDTIESSDITESHENITENNDTNYEANSKPDSCHCGGRDTEMSSIIAYTTQQYVTNRPESDYSSTKAQPSHEIILGESPEPITTTGIISTSGQPEKATVISSNSAASDNNPEQKAKINSALEILNFIKKLEKLLKDQKVPFRIGDETGGVEIKLEKIYIRPGKNQSIAELKDVSEKDQKSDMTDEGGTSEVIHQVDNLNSKTSMRNGNIQGFSRERNENILDRNLNQNSQFSLNANVKNDVSENNFDETSQTIEKPKKYDNAILQTYIEPSVPKSLQADKNARNNKSLPEKQWIDEQRIASNDQSSSRGRKRKKWRRKKRRHRLRKRTANGTDIALKKGKPSYRLRRRRRRRRLSSTSNHDFAFTGQL